MAFINCPTCLNFTAETNNRCEKCNRFLDPTKEIDFLKDQLLAVNNDVELLTEKVIKLTELVEMLIPVAELVEN